MKTHALTLSLTDVIPSKCETVTSHNHRKMPQAKKLWREHREVRLAQRWVRLAQNVTNPGLFRTDFSTLWLDETKCTEIFSEKKSWLILFEANLTRFGPKSDLSAPARLLYNDMTKEVCVSVSSYTSAHPDGLARGPPNLGLASYDANVLMYRLVALDYTPTLHRPRW